MNSDFLRNRREFSTIECRFFKSPILTWVLSVDDMFATLEEFWDTILKGFKDTFQFFKHTEIESLLLVKRHFMYLQQHSVLKIQVYEIFFV
jgi:hypothetical protein